MAKEGMIKYSNKNKDGSASPYTSFPQFHSFNQSSDIQQFIESAGTHSKRQLLNNSINNNNKQSKMSGGWIIDHKEISIMNKVGEGGSGVKNRGKYPGTTVAVEQLHGDNLTSSDLYEFYEEAEVAFNLRFKHVLQVFGITHSAPNIVMEFMKKGRSLINWIMKKIIYGRGIELVLYMASKGICLSSLDRNYSSRYEKFWWGTK